MKKSLYKVQTLVLLFGVIFAWSTVYGDFVRFYNLYGTITKVTHCTVPNPVTTPCFYGAFVFLLAFVWSFKILKRVGKEDITKRQKRLFWVLVAGTVFAWGNFGYEVFKFYFAQSATKFSCSGVPTNNVLLTPCFYGAVIFLTSLVVSLVIRYKLAKPDVTQTY